MSLALAEAARSIKSAAEKVNSYSDSGINVPEKGAYKCQVIKRDVWLRISGVSSSER